MCHPKPSPHVSVPFLFLLCSLVGVGFVSLQAQVPWLFGKDSFRHSVDSLYLSVESQFFFRNNEYFSPYEEGYTLVGFTVRPQLKAKVGDHLTLAGGVSTLMYGGQDRFHHVWPCFSAVIDLSQHLTLQMGSLPGPASHGLHDALLNIEEQYVSRPEFGFRFSAHTALFSGHGWLNWRQFIFLGDTIPEMFTAGLTGTFRIVRGERFSLSLPVGMTFDHVGGQISDFPEPMQSLANAQLTPALMWTSDSSRLVRSVVIKLHCLGFHTMVGSSARPMADGWAIHPEVEVRGCCFEGGVGWFRGHDFWSPHGNSLLMSISNYNPSVYKQDRSIATAYAALCLGGHLGYRFSLEARGFYDTSDSRLDYSYGMAVVVDIDRINLWNRK